MPNITIKDIHDTYDLGDAEVGDYFVGQKGDDDTISGTLNFAPKLNMDPTPTLAGNLILNGHSVTGNLAVANYNSGTNATSTSLLRGDNKWSTLLGTARKVTVTSNTNDLTLTVPNALEFTSVIDSSSNNIMQFATAGALSVNYLQCSNSVATLSPQIAAVGSDSIVDVNLVTKSTGIVNFKSIGISPVRFYSGTGYQHLTLFTFANTNNSRNVTFQDNNGTVAFLTDVSAAVQSGGTSQLAYYSSAGNSVSGLATANNGVLVTNGSGVPSISTTLPTGLAMQTPASITLTNGTNLSLSK